MAAKSPRNCAPFFVDLTVNFDSCPNWSNEMHIVTDSVETTTKQTVELFSYQTVEHVGAAAAPMRILIYILNFR